MNAALIPSLPDGCVLREEAEGGIFISGSGFFRTISPDDLEVLKRVDGCATAYSIARGLSNDSSELACQLIRVFRMSDEGIIHLGQLPSLSSRNARVSLNPPFSSIAFSTPVMVSLAVTDACNRRCRHCYREGVSCGIALSEEAFSSIVEKLSELDIAVLNITGGEPFLYKPTVALASYAASIINSVSISTNGTLLDRADLRSLKKGGVDRIQIGLNAFYDSDPAPAGEGCTNGIFDAMRIASEEGLEVSAGVVLTSNTIGDLDTIFRLSSEAEVAAIRLGPLMNVHQGCEAVQVTVVEVLEATARAKRLAEETGVPLQFVDGLGDPGDVPRNSEERQHYCYLGTGILHIEPDGSLFPCSALLSEEFRLGEVGIRTTVADLMETWRKSEILNDLRRVTIDRLDGCRECGIKALCGGGCRTAAYWNTGSIMGENPFCRLAKGCREK